MKYQPNLVMLSDQIALCDDMFKMILIRTDSLHLTLGNAQCYLSGTYMLCLGPNEPIELHKGKFEALSLGFVPSFYNVNLNHELISTIQYAQLRDKHGFPDFHLFTERNNRYFGVIPISADGYICIRDYFFRIDRYIKNHANDSMWSCHVRSVLISALYYAESAYLGNDDKEVSSVILYIREHVASALSLKQLCQIFRTNRTTLTKHFKELTGMTPMQFVLEERLNQSRSELLFTGLPIGEIALKYGFSDANYYIRAFKRRFGKSPLQYRKECRAKRDQL